jgi:chaperonin GroES
MKVRPLHDRVLVRRSAGTEQRVGGIIIPDSAKEKPQQGTVIAAGHGKKTGAGKRVPLDITVGDRILFGTFSGQEVTLDGDPYLIMKIEEVLAVIEGPAEPRQAAINGRAVKATKAKALPSKRTVKKRSQAQRRKKR